MAALDIEGLLRHLQESSIDYVVIGGVAVSIHGAVRATKDLDIVPDPTGSNLDRLAAALRAIGARWSNTGDFDPDGFPVQPDEEGLRAGGSFELVTDLGQLDVLQTASGLPEDGYATLVAAARVARYGDLAIRVCSLEHLRAMKAAGGRPRDIQDLADLAIAHPEDA